MDEKTQDKILQLTSFKAIAQKQTTYWEDELNRLLSQSEAASHGESPEFKANFVDVKAHINDNREAYLTGLPLLLNSLSTSLVQLIMENNRQLIDLMLGLNAQQRE